MKSRPLVKCLCVLAFGFGLAGCVNHQTAQKAKAKAPVDQLVIDSSKVAVIPNPYVDDFTLANKAADEARQELIRRGYKIVATEAEADLVAIPTVETNVTVVQHAARPIEVFTENAGLPMERTRTIAGSLGSLGYEGSGFSGTVGKNLDELVIEGFRKDQWDKALIVNELQLQPVWKVRVKLPASLKPSQEGAAVARTSDTDFVLPH